MPYESVRYNNYDNTPALVYSLGIVLLAVVAPIFPFCEDITVGVDGFQTLDRYHHVPLHRHRHNENKDGPTVSLGLDSSSSSKNSIPKNDEGIVHDKNLVNESRKQQKEQLNPKGPTINPPMAARDDDRFVLFGKRDNNFSSSTNSSSTSVLNDEIFARVADPYGWMRDDSRSSKAVLEHIESENAYTQQQTRHLTDLQETLEREYHHYSSSSESIMNVDIDVSSVYCQDSYAYYTRRVCSQPYALHCRARLSSKYLVNIPQGDRDELASTKINEAAPSTITIDFHSEEILLDENILVEDVFNTSQAEKNVTGQHVQQYFALHTVLPSPSHGKIAYSVDVTGAEVYQLYIMEIGTGTTSLIDSAASGPFTWGITDDTLYYVRFDSPTLRPCQWMEWTSSPPTATDLSATAINGVKRMVLEEPDERYWCGLRKSSDGMHLFWICESSGNRSHSIAIMDLYSCKVHFMDDPSTARRPERPSTSATMTTTATTGSWYDIDHSHGIWWIVANGNGSALSIRLYTKPHHNRNGDWTVLDWFDTDGDLVVDDEETFAIEGIHTFVGHVVVQGRFDGLPRIWILTLREGNPQSIKAVKRLEFDEEPHYVSVGRNQEYWSTRLVINFESMVSPPQVLAIDLNDSAVRHVLYKRHIVDYKQDLYRCERRHVLSRDGVTRIPISVVYLKEAFQKEGRPCPIHMFAYGAYGHSLEAAFSTIRLSLLNRGVICVVAHGRGGGERGRIWHQSGKSTNKMNSVHDFIDVSRWLIDREWTSPEMLVCEGRSAGGLLVAAAINDDPSLFHAAVLGVPFLDPLCTMADPSLPLTTVEWDEWGDPHRPNDFEHIRRWSPIQNVDIKDMDTYPNILLIGGLYDPRVSYWEPLKYSATIRHASANVSTPCCVYVKIDTGAGHSFGGNRHKYFRELSFIYAFVLDQMGQPGIKINDLDH